MTHHEQNTPPGKRRRILLVLEGQEPQPLGAVHAANVEVYAYQPPADPGYAISPYQEGADYVIDYVAGTIARTADSRIPDWREHPTYGLERFDHRELPYCSNAHYTCLITYEMPQSAPSAQGARQERNLLAERLPRLHARLSEAREAVCTIYGDSISTGAEASGPEHSFFGRFVSELQRRYPEAAIRSEMRAIGGETSEMGLQRIAEVIDTKPDLVLIGYGMNDQNADADTGNAVPVVQYERNIREMITAIRSATGADIVLMTPCLPNPQWLFASSNVRDYAAALRLIASDGEAVLADVQKRWEQALSSGLSHPSLLLNSINHPNDYGHELYYEALEASLLN